jgi:hypothetical protein
MKRTSESLVFLCLAAGVSLPGAVSCGLTDEAPLGKRIEHPDPRSPSLLSSPDETPKQDPPPEETFSPLDKAIAADCSQVPGTRRARPWSQNVPERDCTDDSECGDGYCDRGRCGAIWTCSERYGQRCINGEFSPNPGFNIPWCPGICVEGRCRSCVSHEECIHELRKSHAMCGAHARDGRRSCGLLGPTFYRPVPSRP